MNRCRRHCRASAITCLLLVVCAVSLAGRALAEEQAKGNFEVHDVSLWILEPGGAQANVRTAYPSALPGLVNSARSTAFPSSSRKITPINLITFYGAPASGLDVDLRTKAGSFLAHWPTGEGLPNRLRWSGTPPVDLVEKVEESEQAFVDADHWIRKAREFPSLYIRRGARSERFLAYDTELNLPAPVRLEGGPDTYKVINTSSATLYDVVISCPSPQGRRVAWIDVLPKGEPIKPAAEKKDGADKKDGAKPEPTAKTVEAAAVLDALDAADAQKPAPAAAPVKRSATLFSGIGTKKPADTADKSSPADSKSDAKPAEEKQPEEKKPDDKKSDEKKSEDKKPAEKKADEPKAGEKKAEEPAKAVISPEAFAKIRQRAFGGGDANPPVAAPVKAPASKTPVVPMTGVEVTLSAPLPNDSPETTAQTATALADRLARTGLKPQEVDLFMENYRSLFFEGEAIVVACRLDPGAIDEKIPLSIFPEPTKITRVAMVVMRNADPHLGQEVDRLIAQLGDRKYSAREAASQRLIQLGSLAFEPLQQALNNTDVEIVNRAERILLNQNQTPTPPKPAAAPAAKGAAAGKAAAANVNGVLVVPAK